MEEQVLRNKTVVNYSFNHLMHSKKTGARFTQQVIVRAPALLPMIYGTSELALALGVEPFTIRGWVESGMPHDRDHRGRILIVGTLFSRWVEQERRQRKTLKLEQDEAYCFRCLKPVKLIHPSRRSQGKRDLLVSQCPDCSQQIFKAVRCGQS